jgi:membrane protease YdiL (CAAX protease family)
MELAATPDKKVVPALPLSGGVTLAMLLMAWQTNSTAALLLAFPFSLMAYALYFSIGTVPLAPHIRQWCEGRLLRLLLIPLLLVVLLFFYVVLAGEQPWQGNSWQIPLLFCAPVMFYRWVVGSEAAITWKDAVGAVLCILPYAMHGYPFNSDLPIGGGGIESLYLILAIVVAVYSLVVVRQIERVGFVPYYSLIAFKLVLKSWALVFGLALVCGLPGGLLKWVGYEPLAPALLISALALFLRTLFGTALPEELLFRGVFMNLLLQWLEQSGQWRRYFHGSLILLPLAAVAGYTIDNKAHWFPLLVATTLWALTWWLNRRDAGQAALYTAMLIVSTLFGLAHYHIHSTLFMGLAMIAGWAYGYVYQKTGSVFYSALTHALVNTAPGLFGLALVR